MCIMYQAIQKIRRLSTERVCTALVGERRTDLYQCDAKKNGGHPGIIRNITFDHISMTAESSLFIAGEEDAVIEDVIVENLNLTLKQQGTQNQEFLMSSLPRETCIRMRYRQSISDQPRSGNSGKY